MKTIVFTHAAAKDLDALDADARKMIIASLSAYAIDGRGDVSRSSADVTASASASAVTA